MTALRFLLKTTLASTLLGFVCLATTSFAETKDMDCQKQSPTIHIELAETDQSTASHLSLDRQLTTGASVTLDVCAADLTIKVGYDNHLRIAIDRTASSGEEGLIDYVQALDVNPQGATLKLRLPEKARAKVTVLLPTTIPALEVNLVKGNISLDTGKIEGDRTINLVSGQVSFLGNSDAYQELGTHIVLGSMHDHRQEGKNHHFMVASTLPGTGKGRVEINVVKGRVDLKPSDN